MGTKKNFKDNKFDAIYQAEVWDTPVKPHPHKGIDDLVEGAEIIEDWTRETNQGRPLNTPPLNQYPTMQNINQKLSQQFNATEIAAWWVECEDELDGRAPKDLLYTLDEQLLLEYAEKTLYKQKFQQ